jgi:hypothetical protein
VDTPEYFQSEGLALLLQNYTSDDSATKTIDTQALPPNVDDLVRIHKLIRSRKSFTVLEFGIGFSTLVIADALSKNKAEWAKLDPQPKVRNSFMFQCFSVDTSEHWIGVAKARIPEHLSEHVTFQHSRAVIGTYNGQLCHYYEKLPNVIPDFIYLDGPDPLEVQGEVNGLSFQCKERTPMAADLLLMESTFLPGTCILSDGRTNNVRFLLNNFKRKYKVNWDKKGDVTTIELDEERLGKYNILGSDFLK